MTPIKGMGDVSPWASPEAARKDDKDDGDEGGFAKQLEQAGRKPTRDERPRGNGATSATSATIDAPWQVVAAFMTPLPALPAPAAAPPDASGPRDDKSSSVEAKASDKADKPGESKESAGKTDKTDKNQDAKADAKADTASDPKNETADPKADVKAEKTADHVSAKTEAKSAETVSFKPTVDVAAARQAPEPVTVTMQVAAQAPAPVALATAMPMGITGAPAAALATEADAPTATAAVASLPPDGDVDATPERGHIGTAKAEVVIGEGDDKLSVRITAVGNQVRVEAAAASAGMALMIQRSSEELRAALSQHGLELRELGSDSSEPEGPNGNEQPKDRNQAPRVARQSWRTVA